MDPKLIRIIVLCATRNALQILVGICIGVYICAKNPELDSQCLILFTTLAPIFAIVGGPVGLIVSIFNSLGLWQETPPEK